MSQRHYKTYEYYTVIKTGILWSLVPFGAAVLAASSGKYRFVLFFTVFAAAYGIFLNKLRQKAISINFTDKGINVNGKEIRFSDIENYHTCLPLRKYFMLRLKTVHKKEVFYIIVENREEIERIMEEKNLSLNKTKNDVWLQHSHTILVFIVFFIFANLAMIIFNKF